MYRGRPASSLSSTPAGEATGGGMERSRGRGGDSQEKREDREEGGNALINIIAVHNS
jgi:hypothetical protein